MDDPQHHERLAVGVLSDTHGQLHPEVLKSFESVDHIIHAGDIGSAQVLAALRAVAPVTAVRGNCDTGAWAEALPGQAEVSLGGVRILVVHIVQRASPSTVASGRLPGGAKMATGDKVTAVVFGHSHVASLEERDQVLFVNPGSAGPRRFGRPRTVARLEIVRARADENGAGPAARPQLSAVILPLRE